MPITKPMPTFLMAALSGLGAWCGVYPLNWPFLALICWTPVLVFSSHQSRLVRGSLLLFAGVIANILGFHFVPNALIEVGEVHWLLAWTGLLALAVFQSAHLFFVGCVLPREKYGVLLFPLLLASFESFQCGPFPWTQGNLLHASPLLSQLASVGGGFTLTLASSSVSALLAFAILSKKLSHWALPGIPIALMVSWGSYRFAVTAADDAPPFRELHVGVVQGNFEASRLTREPTIEFYRKRSAELVARNQPLDLLVWPESASTSRLQRDALPRTAADYWLRDRAQRRDQQQVNVPLMLGTPLESPAGVLSNAAVLVSPQGKLLGSYEKRGLVPFGETGVNLGPWYLAPVHEFSAGKSAANISWEGLKFLVTICVEDLNAEMVKNDATSLNPDLLINLTSDAWFDSIAAGELHFQLGKLRSIETGRTLLRVANRGVSGIVDPLGRVQVQLPSATEQAEIWRVELARMPSWPLPIERKYLSFFLILSVIAGQCLIRRRVKLSRS